MELYHQDEAVIVERCLTMTDERRLRPATAEEVEDTLTFALRFKGRKRWDGAGPLIAGTAADHLRRVLEEAGYVVMKTPDSVAPSITRHPYPGG
jgi:hypothetical protein